MLCSSAYLYSHYLNMFTPLLTIMQYGGSQWTQSVSELNNILDGILNAVYRGRDSKLKVEWLNTFVS